MAFSFESVEDDVAKKLFGHCTGITNNNNNNNNK